MRRRVFLAIPTLMAAVAACGSNSGGPATPTQAPTTQTGGTFTLTSPAGVDGGTLGVGSDGPQAACQPPCSQGPGAKLYTFTLYALSVSPSLPVAANQVTGASLTSAIANITLGSASLKLSYTRPQ
jgi:phosphatidylethanolamine-binding protein (PEBP) family uncharacterized protein